MEDSAYLFLLPKVNHYRGGRTAVNIKWNIDSVCIIFYRPGVAGAVIQKAFGKNFASGLLISKMGYNKVGASTRKWVQPPWQKGEIWVCFVRTFLMQWKGRSWKRFIWFIGWLAHQMKKKSIIQNKFSSLLGEILLKLKTCIFFRDSKQQEFSLNEK